MKRLTERMPKSTFDRIASSLNWSQDMLDAMRDLIVDGVAVGKVAKKYGKSSTNLCGARTRFFSRGTKVLAKDFMQHTNAELPADEQILKIFKEAILDLIQRGYSNKQVIEFLATQKVTATDETLRQFLESHEATKR